MTSFAQPLHEHLKCTWTHYFSYCVSDTDWRVILWPDRPDGGSPAKDCCRLTIFLYSTLRITSAGLIETLELVPNTILRSTTFTRTIIITRWILLNLGSLPARDCEIPPPHPCFFSVNGYLTNAPSPSFRLWVYIELSNLRIKAQSPKIKKKYLTWKWNELTYSSG